MSSLALGHHPALPTTASSPRWHRARPSRVTFLCRRAAVITVLLIAVFALGVGIGRAGAGGQAGHDVAGTVTIEPGETLWDVAVATAPDGVDPRRQLAEIRHLNTLTSAKVRPWMVVLIPAR